MSRSSREQVRISLAPHQVALVRLSRGFRGGVADRQVMAVRNEATTETIESIVDGLISTGPIKTGSNKTGTARDASLEDVAADTGSNGNSSNVHAPDINGFGADWSSALEALREIFAHPDIARAKSGRIDAGVILSNHYVRYLVLPWSPALVTPAEEAEFARMRFAEVFGEAANRWNVSIAPAPAGAGRVAAAVDQLLLDTLGQAMSDSPFRLSSMQPALMSQFNAWRRQIGNDAWLVLIERGRALIAWIQNGEWRSVRTRPLGDAPLPLAHWLAQEWLLLDAGAGPSKVCLSVVDDVAVDTGGVQVQTLSPRARAGFVPRVDGELLLAMAGAT